MKILKRFKAGRVERLPVAPCVASLYLALGETPPANGYETDSDAAFRVISLCIRYRNRMYETLSSEDFKRVWPGSAPIQAALRGALGHFRDKGDSSAAVVNHLARRLVNLGHVDGDVLASLNPWWAVLFHWQRRAVSAREVTRTLTDCGLLVEEQTLGKMAVASSWDVDAGGLHDAMVFDEDESPVVNDLIEHFNQHAAMAGHSGRAIRMAALDGEDGGNDGIFLMAEPSRLGEVADRLALPVDFEHLRRLSAA